MLALMAQRGFMEEMNDMLAKGASAEAWIVV
jgi:hypothetical protein